MRVAIITPAAPAHHMHLCARVAERHEVVGVLHPAPRRAGVRAKLGKARRRVGSLGLTYGALHALAAVRNPCLGWDWMAALTEAEDRFFPDAAADYARSGIAEVAHTVDDINGAAAISLVRRLSPDVVVCLGGPIYRQPLIDACPTMVNFHSGVSPLYNGASTIMFAFANGHARLCGGTLMTMSSVVDGGDILAHYLPAIEPNDDPATLFMKTVRGAPEVCSQFLDHVAAVGSFTKVPQPPPLFTCTSEGWTIHHTQRIRRLLDAGACSTDARPEQIHAYWNRASDDEARKSVNATLERLLELA